MPSAWQYAKANYIKVSLSDPVFLARLQTGAPSGDEEAKR